MGKTHEFVNISMFPRNALIFITYEGVVIPEGLVFYGIVDIIRLECNLTLHGNLENRHEKTHEIQVSRKIPEDRLQFTEHIADNLLGIIVFVA